MDGSGEILSQSKGDEKNSILANKLSKLAGWLKEYHLVVEDFTQNPGNSLFDNVVGQIPNCKDTAQELRDAAVMFLRKNREKYENRPDYIGKILRFGEKEEYVSFNDWEGYLEQMKKTQVWATELEDRGHLL